MRLVVQRVKSASVTVRGKGEVSSIGPGVMALVGLHQDDTEEDLKSCCKKLLAAKLFENEEGKLWRYVSFFPFEWHFLFKTFLMFFILKFYIW